MFIFSLIPKIVCHIATTQLLHVALNSLFDPFSYPAITRPGILQVLKQDLKLVIIHDGDFEFLLGKAPSWVTTKLT
jgi:hypothetical protein